MVVEDERYVIHGDKPSVPVPQGLLGKFIYDSLLETHVEHDAMVDAFSGKSTSYDQILKDTCNLGEALRQYGCNSDTIISVCSENSVKFFIPVIASLYLGAKVAPVNHFYTEHELNHILNLYQPKVVFCSLETVEKFQNLKMKMDFIEKIILLDESANHFGIENISTFVNKQLDGKLVDPKTFRPFTNADPCDNVSFIMSSSGTTGLPKGVMLTDRNLLVRVAHSMDPLLSFTKPTHGNTVLGLMPFFHGFGLNVALNALINKEMVVVLKKFDEDVFLKTLQDFKINTIAIAPTLATFLAKSPKVKKYNLSIEEIICGAAPMSKELENELKKRLNISKIRQGYGLTECNLAVTIMKKSDIPKPGSSGPVISMMSIKVRNLETGRSLGPKQVGEICIKGPMVMKGYYKNPQATKETFTEDGWLKTGDLGYYDEDKYFFIVDRLKELIKYKGYQVAPAELEAILLNHPKVMDVGVVGAPDEIAGELPLAFVVKKPGIEVTEQELVEAVAKIVSPQKRLRGGVIFVEAIPKNPSGKILRRELRKIIPHSRINRESKL